MQIPLIPVDYGNINRTLISAIRLIPQYKPKAMGLAWVTLEDYELYLTLEEGEVDEVVMSVAWLPVGWSQIAFILPEPVTQEHSGVCWLFLTSPERAGAAGRPLAPQLQACGDYRRLLSNTVLASVIHLVNQMTGELLIARPRLGRGQLQIESLDDAAEDEDIQSEEFVREFLDKVLSTPPLAFE